MTRAYKLIYVVLVPVFLALTAMIIIGKGHLLIGLILLVAAMVGLSTGIYRARRLSRLDRYLKEERLD